MRSSKSLIIGILIYIVGFGVISAIPLSLASTATNTTIDDSADTPLNVPTPAIPDNGETVGIIVAPTAWNDATYGATLRTLVGVYKLQLEQTGYTVLLQTAALSDPSVETLRAFLQGWHTTYAISGVVLIGSFAYAQFYHPASAGFPAETFVSDLFLMDLDGTWTDSELDGIYDIHSTGTGDIFPEIYLGRIDATTRTLGGLTNVQNIISVLNKAANYRGGMISRTHQAITYVDDDWIPWADGTNDNWPAWLNSPYPVRTDVYTPGTLTTAADWTTRLTQDYEWAHLCAHSGATPAQHYFGPGGVGEGTLTSAQIHAIQPTFNFYNLYCCHGADWLTSDCLATTYLYSSSYSLTVIGTTKTGGMFGGASFYNALGQDKTIGQAFHDWFQSIITYSPTQYIEWFYGMSILGDPFLTTVYDFSLYEPTIVSSTHPNESNWYSNNMPQMGWDIPVDVNGIAGYYTIYDQNPTTNPTVGTGTFTPTNSSFPATFLNDGTWYFHLLTVDGAGNEVVTHYTLNIDTTAPTISISAPTDGFEMQKGILTLIWTVTDGTSGYDHATIFVNGSVEATVQNPITQQEINFDSAGSYLITVQGFDGAGLQSTDSITITILAGLVISPYFYIIGGAAVVIVVVVIIIVASKRKKKKSLS